MRALITVFAKEFMENLRDRRTLVSALLFGPLFGPLLFGLMVSRMLDRMGNLMRRNSHCEGNGEDTAFLDETTMARVRCARSALDVRAVLRLYVDRVPEVGYEDSCIFHGKQGCVRL